jgi:transcriptional regulator with XRE-family HTH domain
METLTEKQLIEQLWDMVAANGSQKKVAEILNITPAYLGDILHGRRNVSDKVSKLIGYAKTTVYQEVK